MTRIIDSSNSAKYTLRTKSLLKRVESERSRDEMKHKEPKEKQKPPPLSKYRRKTANARERSRMREINEAFETLQKTLPDLPGVDAEKLTKITVLRLAVNYIKILSHVTDEDLVDDKDIEELRQLWCVKNAHMARPEHCVRPVFRPTKAIKSPKQSSPKPKPTKSKVSKLSNQTLPLNGSSPKKRPSKSRIRGKVCKTASVATSNGAYITLKNVAFQTTPNRRTHLDNKPLMMSMTVKRPRLEHINFDKPSKIARYEPPKPQKRPPAVTKINAPVFSHPFIEKSSPLFGVQSLDSDLSCFTIYDLQTSDLNKNLRLSSYAGESLDYNQNLNSSFNFKNPILKSIRGPSSCCTPKDVSSRLSSTSSCDSAETCFLSPIPSLSPSDSLFNASSSDSDSDFNASLELDSLLASEPFEEQLENLTSSFIDTDDTLSQFLDHSSSNFICTDMNIY